MNEEEEQDRWQTEYYVWQGLDGFGASFWTLLRSPSLPGGVGLGNKGTKEALDSKKEVHIEADWRGGLFKEKDDFVVGEL